MLNTSASVFVPPTAPSMRVDTLYGTTRSAKQALSSETKAKFVSKFKTELCKNWIEAGFCRYRDTCKFAHGKEEMVFSKHSSQSKNKNCKTYFKTGQCPYGPRCIFDHEHRQMKQIMRYHHTVTLITYESLFANAVD